MKTKQLLGATCWVSCMNEQLNCIKSATFNFTGHSLWFSAWVWNIKWDHGVCHGTTTHNIHEGIQVCGREKTSASEAYPDGLRQVTEPLHFPPSKITGQSPSAGCSVCSWFIITIVIIIFSKVPNWCSLELQWGLLWFRERSLEREREPGLGSDFHHWQCGVEQLAVWRWAIVQTSCASVSSSVKQGQWKCSCNVFAKVSDTK